MRPLTLCSVVLTGLHLVSALLPIPPHMLDDDRQLSSIQKQQRRHQISFAKPELKKVKVPLTLGVMSKCPDAAICESVIDKALASVSHLVELNMLYIGSVNTTVKPYGVACKHGPSECDGNVQQLCVKEHAQHQKKWWNFIQCQNFDDVSRVGDISLAKKCSKIIGYNWDNDFSACFTGKEGRQLLLDSVKQAHDKNITTSCSIFIGSDLVCKHDGVWKECPGGHEPDDFIKLIRKEHVRLNP